VSISEKEPTMTAKPVLHFVGYDGERAVGTAMTQQQIDQLKALQCDLVTGSGEPITWTDFDNPDELAAAGASYKAYREAAFPLVAAWYNSSGVCCVNVVVLIVGAPPCTMDSRLRCGRVCPSSGRPS